MHRMLQASEVVADDFSERGLVAMEALLCVGAMLLEMCAICVAVCVYTRESLCVYKA